MNYLDLFIQHVVPLIVGIFACTNAFILIKHYNQIRDEYLYQNSEKKDIPLIYLSKLSHLTVLISFIYILVETNELVNPNGLWSDSIWSLMIALFFAVLGYLCLYGKSLVHNEFKYDFLKKQNVIINAMVEAAGGYVWYKDIDNKYLFCDPSWCVFFFHLDNNCAVLGFDDKELLDTFRSTKNMRHTFGDLCKSTDDHTKNLKKQCRYIECGYIGDKLVVLDVLKTPLFNEDEEYTGIIGFAWEKSKECEDIFGLIENYLKSGRAEQLDDGVYYIKDKDDECIWNKPFPSA